MKLIWSALAFEDRERIFDYIEKRNPRAALEIDELLSAQVTQLEEFPESGRQGRLDSTRELVITNTPYLVAYQISRRDEVVLILRILHGAQQWPENL